MAKNSLKIDLPIKLQGVHGSPYTRKALAALRYRRLPYRFIIGQPGTPAGAGNPDAAALPVPKVVLLPTFYFTDESGTEQAVTDTTPILRRLEAVSSERRIIPPDPVVALVNYILEDYCDEWLTRCMFHFRWAHEADIDKSGSVLPFLSHVTLPSQQAATLKAIFSERQTGRLHVVGSNETTKPVIEDSFVRFLEIMDAHLQRHNFLLGNRPGSADFAAFGQLTCLTHFDPTPMRITLERSPRTYAWVERAEDLCGYEVDDADWLDRDSIDEVLGPLLREVARTHMPQMLANAKALANGDREVSTAIDGHAWVQPPFSYQAKCLRWTREEMNALAPADRQAARTILEACGLLPLIDEPLAS